MVADPAFADAGPSIAQASTSLSGFVGLLSAVAVPHIWVAYGLLLGYIRVRHGEVGIVTTLAEWTRRADATTLGPWRVHPAEHQGMCVASVAAPASTVQRSRRFIDLRRWVSKGLVQDAAVNPGHPLVLLVRVSTGVGDGAAECSIGKELAP